MRMAGRMPPCTETRPTPVISLRRCAISVSARSLMRAAGWCWRGQRQGNDRRVGRVHLRIDRRIGQGAAAASSRRR